MLKKDACGANATATIKRSEFNAGKCRAPTWATMSTDHRRRSLQALIVGRRPAAGMLPAPRPAPGGRGVLPFRRPPIKFGLNLGQPLPKSANCHLKQNFSNTRSSFTESRVDLHTITTGADPWSADAPDARFHLAVHAQTNNKNARCRCVEGLCLPGHRHAPPGPFTAP